MSFDQDFNGTAETAKPQQKLVRREMALVAGDIASADQLGYLQRDPALRAAALRGELDEVERILETKDSKPKLKTPQPR